MAHVASAAHGEGIPNLVLDEVFQDYAKSYVCKIDVEGHELAVLQGMRTLLQSARCFLQIEVLEGNQENVIQWMAQAGYRQVHSIKEDFYFTNEAGGLAGSVSR